VSKGKGGDQGEEEGDLLFFKENISHLRSKRKLWTWQEWVGGGGEVAGHSKKKNSEAG